jgi:peptidoglycan/LPS O-acetylase OafA/YrhL
MLAANAKMLPAVFDAPFVEDVYWTLEIEIRFYGLIFLALIAHQMPRVELWLYAWLLVSVVALFVELPGIVQYVALTPYGPFFVAGCLFYLVSRNGLNATRAAALIIAAAACAYVSIGQRGQFITPDTVSAIVVPCLMLSFFAVFALLALARRTLRGSRLVYRLGELTYPLYLTHAMMGLLVYELLGARLGAGISIVVISVLALLVAWIVTVTVDRPARKPFANFLYGCARASRIYRPATSDTR